jgi:actin-related protein
MSAAPAEATSNSIDGIEAVVFDNGSSFLRTACIGNNEVGENSGKCLNFPSIVGRPKHNPGCFMTSARSHYVGDDAIARCGILKVDHPIVHGLVTNWDDLELLWHHAFFNELRVDPMGANVLHCFSPANKLGFVGTDGSAEEQEQQRSASRKFLGRLAQSMFESFQVGGLFACTGAEMSLYAEDTLTGLVLDSGEDVTTAVPIVDGAIVCGAVQRLPAQIGAGSVCTERYKTLLERRGYSMLELADWRVDDFNRRVMDQMKRETAFVAARQCVPAGIADAVAFWASPQRSAPVGRGILDAAGQLRPPVQQFELYNKPAIDTTVERWLCAEQLFDPRIDEDVPSVGQPQQTQPQTQQQTQPQQQQPQQSPPSQRREGMQALRGSVQHLVYEAAVRAGALVAAQQQRQQQQALASSSGEAADAVTQRLLGNVVLAGGNTKLAGFAERLGAELGAAGLRCRVVAPERRDESAVEGGVALARSTRFRSELVIRKRDYDEEGPDRIVLRRALA